MAEWCRITPSSPVKEIETQRERVLELRSRIGERRKERDAAAALVIELEKQDRQRMAELLARGEDAASDVAAVERAKADAAGAARTHDAAMLAAEIGEQELHALIVKHRARWSERAARAVTESRAEARRKLEAFEAAVRAYREAQTIEAWLASGLDREQPPRSGVLGGAPQSERISANSSPVDLSVVFQWLHAVTAEPEPPKSPAPAPQPLAPAPPMMGAITG